MRSDAQAACAHDKLTFVGYPGRVRGGLFRIERDKRWLLRLPILLGAALALPFLTPQFGPTADLERTIHDAYRFVLAERTDYDPDIALVVYDDQVARTTQRTSPVDRELLAQAITTVASAQPKAIGLDMAFIQETDQLPALIAALRGVTVPIYVVYADPEGDQGAYWDPAIDAFAREDQERFWQALAGSRVQKVSPAIGAGPAQHPFAQLADKSRILGDRNEIGRRHHAAFPVMPAQQGLEAGDVSGHDIVLQLIIQFELVPFYGLGQVDFQSLAIAVRLVHGGIIEADGLAEATFGPRHGQIRAMQQIVRILSVVGIKRYADARGDRNRLVAPQDRAGDCGGQPVGERPCLSLMIHVLLDRHELVAAEPGEEFLLAELRGDPVRHGFENLIPGSYYVVFDKDGGSVVNPEFYTLTTPNQGVDESDSDADLTTGRSG